MLIINIIKGDNIINRLNRMNIHPEGPERVFSDIIDVNN